MYRRISSAQLKEGQHFVTSPGGWVMKAGPNPLRYAPDVVLVPSDHDPRNVYAVLDAWCTRFGNRSVEKRYSKNSRLVRHGEAIALQLHETSIIMCWPNGNVMLATGGEGGNTGWPTQTTSRYLEDTLPGGWGVWRTETPWSKKTWVVLSPNVEFLFRERMIVNLFTEEEVSSGLEGPVISWPKGYHADPEWSQGAYA